MRALDELERVSLLLVMGGLALIYMASVAYEPPHVSLEALDESYLGETVVVDGIVSRHDVRESAQFITLEDGEERLSVVYFGSNVLDIEPSERYRVQGTVDAYKGELEIILPSEQAIDAIT